MNCTDYRALRKISPKFRILVGEASGDEALRDKRWNSVHKFEPLVFELLGVYTPVLTLLSFPCISIMVLKPKKWIRHQVE